MQAAADEPIAGLSAVTVGAGGEALAVGAHSISTFITPLCGVNMFETRGATRWTPKAMPSHVCSWLDSVVALPHHRAWAVGYKISGGKPHTLTEYFNGSHWKIKPSPNPGASEDILAGVAVTRSGTVYAVGHAETAGFIDQSLILKWTGSHWTRMPAPGAALLQGVTVTRSGDVWATGYFLNSSVNYQAITLRLTASGWTSVPTPSPGGNNATELSSIAAGKHNTLWTVGWYFDNSNRQRTLTMRYHGGRWSQVASPSPASTDFLYSVAVAPNGTPWTVGADVNAKCEEGLTERFTGGHWAVVHSPHVGKCAEKKADALYGVAVAHNGTVYAVGQQAIYTLVEQFTKGRWRVVRSSS